MSHFSKVSVEWNDREAIRHALAETWGIEPSQVLDGDGKHDVRTYLGEADGRKADLLVPRELIGEGCADCGVEKTPDGWVAHIDSYNTGRHRREIETAMRQNYSAYKIRQKLRESRFEHLRTHRRPDGKLEIRASRRTR